MMKKTIIAVLTMVALAGSLLGCKSGETVKTDPNLDLLTNCTHIEEYHNIPAELVRYVGNEKIEQEFTSIYKDKEGYNIINFLKVFDITKKDFTTVKDNYHMRMNAESEYDIELMYSGDNQKIQDYFTKK